MQKKMCIIIGGFQIVINTKINGECRKINADNKLIFPYRLLISKIIKEYIMLNYVVW